MKRSYSPIALTLITVSALCAGAAYAQQAATLSGPPAARIISDKELLSAKPFVNPLRAPDVSRKQPDSGASGLAPGSVSGASGPSTNAFGSFGVPYTSTRVQLGVSNQTLASAGPAYLSTTFPYRTIGKLTFQVGPDLSHCSATVIRRGVIVTAAHCIQDFGAGGVSFTNFQFTPGHWGAAGATTAQIRPYGTFTFRRVVWPNTWKNGTDVGEDAARHNDLAVLALNRNTAGQFVADLVGKLGYGWNNTAFTASASTGNLRVAATSTLGYPGLLDDGRLMQRADGPAYLTTVGGAFQITQGSNFTAGSSGGPWIANFISQAPVFSDGASTGTQATTVVIGVTSWGSAEPNVAKDNYSSQFRQNPAFPAANYGGRGAGNIGGLLNILCSSPAGAPHPAGQTLAQAGYCS